MRKSLRRTTLVLAVIFSISAVSLPGCSTSNAFKMPSSDWLSWGKKKPANTALTSKPTANLPAPPSSLASPNTVPSYAQGAGATSGGYATSPYRSPTASGTPATPASYGTQPGSANTYPNAAYGAAPGAAQSAPPANAYGGSGASQGFYSNDYRGAAAPAGAPNAYAGQAGPAGPPATHGADAYGAYGQSGYAGTSQTGQGWSQGGAPAPYDATANAYGQPAAPPALGSYDPTGNHRGNDGYAAGGGAYGGSTYGDINASAAPMPSAQQPYPAAVASGGYRPGSTARNTQFGTSERLNVPGESVQPASFAGSSQGGSGSSLSAPSPVGGNSNYQYGEDPPTRTATGSDSNYPYPNTYQR